MDLATECSALESVQDNELTPADPTLEAGEANNNLKPNGLSSDEIQRPGSSGNLHSTTLPHDLPVVDVAGINSPDSEPLGANSPAGGSPPTTKGFGLKKWKRIRRDVVKDASANVDTSKVLKRLLPTSVNASKPTNLTPVDTKPISEGSVGSVNMSKNALVADGPLNLGSSLESRFPVASAFAAGADSENSEDRSSKSSTAASAPRMRFDHPAVVRYAQEKNRLKNMNGNGVGSSAQRVQQGKGRVESSKKPRGEKVKIEKENSHSSMESDSRSSNFVFMQGAHSVTSNGKQSGRSMNDDGENSDDANAVEQPFGEEVHSGYGQENIEEVENISEDEFVAEASWKGHEEQNENHRQPTDEDPLAMSILSLQSVQEALQNEVKRLGEVGMTSTSAGSTSSDLGIRDSSSDQFDSEILMQSSLVESEVVSLTKTVKHLESSLEEAKAMLKVKESRVAELEATWNNSSKEELGNTPELHQDKSTELEIDLEGLFKQKIEAEIECLALTWTLQKLRDGISLFEQQKALAGEQVQMLNKLGQAESKVATLSKRADQLKEYHGDILEAEEVLKMQRRVCGISSCFFLQLILLIFVFWLVLSQLSPRDGVVVPT